MQPNFFEQAQQKIDRFADSQAYLVNLMQALDVFIPTELPEDTKPKMENNIAKAYEKAGLYDLQLKAKRIAKDLEISHLLGTNENVVQPMVDEYSALSQSLKSIQSAMASLKPFAPTKVLIEEMLGAFRIKDLGGFLSYDLKILGTDFEVDIDLPAVMGQFKDQK